MKQLFLIQTAKIDFIAPAITLASNMYKKPVGVVIINRIIFLFLHTKNEKLIIKLTRKHRKTSAWNQTNLHSGLFLFWNK